MTRSRILFPLAVLSAFAGPPQASAADCPTLSDPSERLACFDERFPNRPPSRVIAGTAAPAASAPATEVAAAPKPAFPPAKPAPVVTPGAAPEPAAPAVAGGWQSDEERSDSGFTNSFVWVDAAEEVRCDGQTYRPSLFLRCLENETAVLLVTDCPVTSTGVGGLVSYQVDNGPTRLRTFLERTDQTALGLWDYGTALPFLRDIAAGRALRLRYTPMGETRQQELNFSISGAAAAIAQIDAACGR
jgi:hypothetical protein